MKRKILFLSVLAICIAIAAAGTLAYFTAEGRAHNVITTGSINITVIEQQRGDDDKLVDYPETPIENVMPGMEISKVVTIQNDGSSPAWIRVRVEKEITLNEQNPAVEVGFNADNELIVLAIGGEGSNWIAGEDGYYYYKLPVEAGEATEPLFDTVTFDTKMGNEYQGCTANIKIYAQAVQTANNAPEGGVTAVAGWPD
ncbi:MAG: SipW-dependent-type signal peptide-containing protein [Candidatus Flemingiibacterium sp.]